MSCLTLDLMRESKAASRKPAELRWDMTAPCESCPFRKDVPKHEGVAKALAGYAETIKAGNFAHTCHKTDPFSDYESPKGALQHCAGAAIMLMGERIQVPMLAAIGRGAFDPSRLQRDDPRVFGSLKEMGRAYLPFIRSIMLRLKQQERWWKNGRCIKCGAYGAMPETRLCGFTCDRPVRKGARI